MINKVILVLIIIQMAACGKDERLRQAETYFHKGLVLEKEGNFSSAAAQYQAALLAFPAYKEARFQLGNVYDKLNLPAKAREEYLLYIETDPNDARAYNNLGNAEGQLNRLDEAIADYEKAIALDPALATAHYNLGHAYFLKNDFTRAEAELRKAVDGSPGEFKFRQALALLYSTQQKNAEAIALLQPRDTNPQAHFQLAMAYKNEKRYDEAVRELEIYLSMIDHAQSQTIIRNLIREIKQAQNEEKLALQRRRLNALKNK